MTGRGFGPLPTSRRWTSRIVSNDYRDFQPLDVYQASPEIPVSADLVRPPPRKRRWWVYLSVMVVIVVPWAYLEFPREMARWHVAAALEHHEAGDLIGALKSLDTARQWDAKGQDEFFRDAIQSWNQEIQRQPFRSDLYLQRGSVYHLFGHHEEALNDCAKAVQLLTSQMSTSLNGLAYARALSKSNLDQALDEINQAIRLLGPNAAMLDTRGYLYFLKGEHGSARKDLDASVEMMEAEYKALLAELQPEVKTTNIQRQRLEQRRASLASTIAVIRYHRSQTYDALQLTAEAEQDRQRIRELGATPGDQLF